MEASFSDIIGVIYAVVATVCFFSPRSVKFNDEPVPNPFLRAILGPLMLTLLFPIGAMVFGLALIVVPLYLLGALATGHKVTIKWK